MASLGERLLGAWNVLRGVRRATDTSGGIDGLPDRVGTAPDPDGDLRTRSLTWEVFKHYTHLEPDRYSVYSDMDEMFLHVLVSSAMEAYIEDALQEDVRTGKVIAIKAANPLVVQAIDELFKRIELEDRISGDLWAIGKYGDYFNLLMYAKGENAGIYDARPLEPRVVHRHENLRRVLTGFTIGDQNEVNQLRDQEPKYKPWDVVHFRIRRFRPIDPYGTPFFINCRLIYKTLKLMEEQMAMYRMKMHPDRLIFKVWCGNQSPDESLRTMRKWKKALDRVSAINHDTGKFVSESSVWGQLEDIVWPVHNNDDQSGVEKFPGCFTGDTKISLLNGTEVPIKDLVGKDEFWVYSFGSDGRMYPGRGHSARLTKENTPVVKVTLDNGETIRCTPDHRFMLRDGTYKEAASLSSGESLMPLYRKVDEFGYEMFSSNVDYIRSLSSRPLHCSICGGRGHNKRSCGREPAPNWVYTHRVVASEAPFVFGRIPDGCHIHHCNFNKRDNSPTNLEVLSDAKHTALHCKHLEFSIHSPEAKAAAVAAIRDRYADPAWREKKCRQQSELIQSGKVGFKNPTIRAKAIHTSCHKRTNKFDSNCQYCVANHKVVSVVPDGTADVYDITVDGYSNFSLSAGVVAHNSSNSGDILDVMYMRDLLFAGTRMPKAYMGFEDSQGYRASDTLSQQSVKFARGVKRIRRPLLQGLIRLCKIHLELRGINTSSPENAFELVMTPVNYLEDAQKSEYFAKRFETVNYMMDMGEKMAAALGINLQLWASYVMTEFAGFDDATVAKLMSPVQPDGAGIPNMIFSPGTTQITYEQREKLREAAAGNEGLRQLVDKLVFYEGAIPSPDKCTSSEVLVEAPTSTSSDEMLFREAEEASNKAFEKTAQDERNKVSRLREELLSIARKVANGGTCDD